MKGCVVLMLYCIFSSVRHGACSRVELYEYLNSTEPARRQLEEFKLTHPQPIGIATTSAGKIIELRESVTLNSDSFSNPYFIDQLTHSNVERIPERFVHAKGTAAFGYFEVTNDVSKFTKADVFNVVGKKTPVVGRFSGVAQNLGGSDLLREQKGFSVKMYTKEGNLDLLCLTIPVFFMKDPHEFPPFVRSAKRNPKTNLFDPNMRWDFITKRADNMHAQLWALSEFGNPNGYRKANYFPIHTYELNNKHGDIYFVRFNFLTDQGLEFLSPETAEAIGSRDPDYFNRDLYNAIENKEYPSWTLEMDVLALDDLKKIDYDPFDLTRLFAKDTYETVTIGRLVFNRNPDNQFRDSEQSAFNPGNLVPGIPGPMDSVFRARRSSYRDTQTYRLGINHNRIEVNKPLYYKVYNRDGVAPVRENMRDAPNYYPNSFNGPVPFVDPSRPKERFTIYEPNTVDLQQASDFYNIGLQCDEQRQRLVNNTVSTLVNVSPELRRRSVRLLTLTDVELGARVGKGLERALRVPPPPPPPAIKWYSHDKNARRPVY